MTDWLVQGLIPKGHCVLILGTPHAGKSWFLEQVGACVSTGSNLFGVDGFTTRRLPVILIDEDTPTDVLESRLRRLGLKHLSLKGKTSFLIRHQGENSIFDIWSMTGFRLQDNRALIEAIQEYGDCLILLDSLLTISGTHSLNRTETALWLAEEWKKLRSKGATILIAHHTSLKKIGTEMTSASMGNTQLIAQSDTVLGIERIQPEKPARFKVTPKSRRVALSVTDPFFLELQETRQWVQLSLMDHSPEKSYGSDIRILPLFINDQNRSVKEIWEQVKEDLSLFAVRSSMHRLESEGCLIRGTEAHNRFTYHLNQELSSDYSVLSVFQEQLLGDIQQAGQFVNDLDVK